MRMSVCCVLPGYQAPDLALSGSLNHHGKPRREVSNPPPELSMRKLR